MPQLSRFFRQGGDFDSGSCPNISLNPFPRSRNLTVASPPDPDYDEPVAKANKFDLEEPAPILDEEDEETLAAIDDGIRDAEAGRVVPAEKPREPLPKWTTDSSSRKRR
jgi:hypothetical protein